MLLKNGHLIDPATKTNEPVDIRVENGTIVELGKDLSAKDNEEVLDLSGLTVAPGLVDTHVHFRDPGLTYKEDIHAVPCHGKRRFLPPSSAWRTPNLLPAFDSVGTLKDILTRAQDENIHIYQTASVSLRLKRRKNDKFRCPGRCRCLRIYR